MENLIKTIQTDILVANKTHCTSKWFTRNIFDNFSRLYYIVDGEGEVEQNKRVYMLTPGTLTVIPAHTLLHFNCRHSMDVLWIHFNASFLGGIDFFDLIDCERQLVPANKDSIRKSFYRLITLYNSSIIGKELEMDGILRQLLALFYRTVDVQMHMQRIDTFIRFKPALDYIALHWNRTICLKEIASTMHLHPTYFSNLFTKSFGVSPRQYILNRRAEKAKNLLLRTNDTLSVIGDMCGFSDSFHFSKTFKKVTGLSPQKYRQQQHLPL